MFQVSIIVIDKTGAVSKNRRRKNQDKKTVPKVESKPSAAAPKKDQTVNYYQINYTFIFVFLSNSLKAYTFPNRIKCFEVDFISTVFTFNWTGREGGARPGPETEFRQRCESREEIVEGDVAFGVA